MFFAILSGVGVALGSRPGVWPVLLVTALVVGKAVFDIAIPGGVITGTGQYGLFIENLKKVGELPRNPWLNYLIQSCLFYIPLALISFFLTNIIS